MRTTSATIYISGAGGGYGSGGAGGLPGGVGGNGSAGIVVIRQHKEVE